MVATVSGPCAPVGVKWLHKARLGLPHPKLNTTTEMQQPKKSLQVERTLGNFLGLKKLSQLTRKVGDTDRFSYTLPSQVGGRRKGDARNLKHCGNSKEVFFKLLLGRKEGHCFPRPFRLFASEQQSYEGFLIVAILWLK